MVPTYAVDFSFSLLFGCRFRSEGGTKVCKTKYYKDRFVLAVISEINNSEQYSSDEQNLILFSDHLLILCSLFIDCTFLFPFYYLVFALHVLSSQYLSVSCFNLAFNRQFYFLSYCFFKLRFVFQY